MYSSLAHNFYLCKLEIENVCVLDFYGGPHFVNIDDYYKANYDWDTEDYAQNTHSNSENEINLDPKEHKKEVRIVIDVIRVD